MKPLDQIRSIVLLFVTFGCNSLFVTAQNIGINTTGNAPNASAMLDIDASDKGILIPRLALTATTSASPVSSPATGLMIYNTATVNDVMPGFYYWNGSAWMLFMQRTPTIQVFTSSGTWTKPAGVTKIKVRVVGGGGGGGSNIGAGGGAGGYAEKVIDVSGFSSETVTVGSGGAGGNGGSNGTNGGTSSFGAFCSASGGTGGAAGGGVYGSGGAGSGGDINLSGGTGDPAEGGSYGGRGGSSVFGGAGTGGSTAYGSGGSGGGGSNGVAGNPGIVIIDEY